MSFTGLTPRSLFDVGTILGQPGQSSEPFCHSHEGFPAPSPCPTKDFAGKISVCYRPLLFVIYLFNWTEVISLFPSWVNHTQKKNVPLILYMMMSNPQLTRITHSGKTRSQFQGRANNSPPCHCLNKIFPRHLGSSVI